MRVGFFTLRIDERPTGLANYTQRLTYGLRDLDEDIEVYLLNPHRSSNLEWYRDFRRIRSVEFLDLAAMRRRPLPPLLSSGWRCVNSSSTLCMHLPPRIGYRPRLRRTRVATVLDVSPLV